MRNEGFEKVRGKDLKLGVYGKGHGRGEPSQDGLG